MTVVRRYRPSDRGAALALAPRLTEGVAVWRDRARVKAAVERWVVDAIDEADADLLVADHSGVVVGFVSLREREHWSGGRDAYVGALAVARDVEGHGVGRALVDAASAWADERDLSSLTLETGAANERARGFYARLGFRDEDVRLTLLLSSPSAAT